MPINFPSGPSSGQLYTYDNKTWEYNGIYWEVYSGLTSYVGGTGTTQTIPKWSNTNTLTDSQIIDNGTQVYIPILSAITYYGNGSNLTGIPKGGGGSGQVYYFNISSAQTPYYEFSTIPTGNAQQSLSASTGSTQTAYIGGFMTPSNTPYVTNFPAGIISFYIHSYTSDATATFNLYCELYKRDISNVETLLFTSDPVIVAGTSTVMYITDGFFSGATLTVNDRLIVKVYATNTSNQTRSITMLSEGSQHYSFSLTTLPIYSYGTGTSNFITKWTNSTTLGNSIIQDNGVFVGVGYGTPYIANSTFGANRIEFGYIFQINGNPNSSLSITDTDYSAWGTSGNEIAIGTGSPLGQSTGNDNVAIGSGGPLSSNTGGYENIAIGASPLSYNETGYYNIAIGSGSLKSNVGGRNNISIGYNAGFGTFGINNVFIGANAGYSTTGSSNVFIGNDAGYYETGDGKLYIANKSSEPLIYGDFNSKDVVILGSLSATTYQNLPYSGTVTSVSIAAGNLGTDVNITNSAITTSGTITINIPDAGQFSRGLVTTGLQAIAGVKNFVDTPILSSLSANQILALDATKNITSLTTVTYPSLTELSYVKNVTSAIQTQLNNKFNTSGGTVSGNLTITGNTTISGLTASQLIATNASDTLVSLDTATYPSLTELTYVKGVTSAIQTQLNNRLQTTGGTINGALTTTGDTTALTLVSSQSSGDEGGEVRLAKPATNSTISGTSVTVDIFQNRLRFFESGGSNRGAFIDLTSATAGVGSNLLLAAGGSDYYTIVCNAGGLNLADSTTYYMGQGGYAVSTTVNTRNVYIPFTSVLTNVTINAGAINAASTEDTTVIFRLNNTTDTTLSSTVKFSGGNAQSNGTILAYNITGLNISVTAGNFFEIKFNTPAWATNPTNASLLIHLYFRR